MKVSYKHNLSMAPKMRFECAADQHSPKTAHSGTWVARTHAAVAFQIVVIPDRDLTPRSLEIFRAGPPDWGRKAQHIEKQNSPEPRNEEYAIVFAETRSVLRLKAVSFFYSD